MKASQVSKRPTSAIKTQIDENLKRVYREALSEDVPDRFKDLLAQLQASQPKETAEEPPT